MMATPYDVDSLNARIEQSGKCLADKGSTDEVDPINVNGQAVAFLANWNGEPVKEDAD